MVALIGLTAEAYLQGSLRSHAEAKKIPVPQLGVFTNVNATFPRVSPLWTSSTVTSEQRQAGSSTNAVPWTFDVLVSST